MIRDEICSLCLRKETDVTIAHVMTIFLVIAENCQNCQMSFVFALRMLIVFNYFLCLILPFKAIYRYCFVVQVYYCPWTVKLTNYLSKFH